MDSARMQLGKLKMPSNSQLPWQSLKLRGRNLSVLERRFQT